MPVYFPSFSDYRSLLPAESQHLHNTCIIGDIGNNMRQVFTVGFQERGLRRYCEDGFFGRRFQGRSNQFFPIFIIADRFQGAWTIGGIKFGNKVPEPLFVQRFFVLDQFYRMTTAVYLDPLNSHL